MRILVTNTDPRGDPLSIDFATEWGDVIRELVPPGATINVGKRSSPYDLNLDEVLHRLIRQGAIAVTVAADPDDIVGLPVGSAVRLARVATTGPIALGGLGPIDGVTLSPGDRVLVKDQGAGAQNGLYVATAGVWTRAPDADAQSGLESGMFVVVWAGATQGPSAWALATPPPIVVGTTPLSFLQISPVTPPPPTLTDRLVRTGFDTTANALVDGEFGYVLGSGVLQRTNALTRAASIVCGANEGTAGSMTTDGVVSRARFTTAGGQPANGALVYLAPGDEEAGAAGKLSAAPAVADGSGKFLTQVGLVLDNTAWTASKTCVIQLRVMPPIGPM